MCRYLIHLLCSYVIGQSLRPVIKATKYTFRYNNMFYYYDISTLQHKYYSQTDYHSLNWYYNFASGVNPSVTGTSTSSLQPITTLDNCIAVCAQLFLQNAFCAGDARTQTVSLILENPTDEYSGLKLSYTGGSKDDLNANKERTVIMLLVCSDSASFGNPIFIDITEYPRGIFTFTFNAIEGCYYSNSTISTSSSISTPTSTNKFNAFSSPTSINTLLPLLNYDKSLSNNNMPSYVIIAIILIVLIALGILIVFLKMVQIPRKGSLKEPQVRRMKDKNIRSSPALKKNFDSSNPNLRTLQIPTKLTSKNNHNQFSPIKKPNLNSSNSISDHHTTASLTYHQSKHVKVADKTNVSNNKSDTQMLGMTTIISPMNMTISIPAYLKIDSSEFQKGKILTSGAFGQIFLVTARLHSSLHSRTQGKLLAGKLMMKGKTTMQQFLQELSMMSLFLGFENFVNVVGYDDVEQIIITEYYPCGSLNSWMRNVKSIKLHHVIKVLQGVATALDQMYYSVQENFIYSVNRHIRGLVHNDLKPANILIKINQKGEPVGILTDFGLANIVNDVVLKVQHFEVANIAGTTMAYCAPDRILAQFPAVSAENAKRADIFSMGMVIYAVIVRSDPWSNKRRNK